MAHLDHCRELAKARPKQGVGGHFASYRRVDQWSGLPRISAQSQGTIEHELQQRGFSHDT